ncbi:hypothetical protein NQ318_011602 [Aromia moschata]|uniref:Uncharacterized protein n=1 Tax=Aromia moschata TaxID=1265417 RepID=A0AAV8Z6J2_9CUCU|nr:hypothetical protein NQ318_011602 [Aromia moschata]
MDDRWRKIAFHPATISVLVISGCILLILLVWFLIQCYMKKRHRKTEQNTENYDVEKNETITKTMRYFYGHDKQEGVLKKLISKYKPVQKHQGQLPDNKHLTDVEMVRLNSR